MATLFAQRALYPSRENRVSIYAKDVKEMDFRLPPRLRAVNRPIAPRWNDKNVDFRVPTHSFARGGLRGKDAKGELALLRLLTRRYFSFMIQ
jgi:hypothetical protein